MNKDELLDNYRYANVEYDGWWESVYLDFMEDMDAKGVPVTAESIEFSGFSHQGSGARFSCSITDENFDKFCKVHSLYEEYPIIKVAVDYQCDPYVTVATTSGMYTHSNCTSVMFGRTYDFESFLPYGVDDDDPRATMLRGLDDQWDLSVTDEPGAPSIEKVVTEVLRGYMDELYRKLEAEYYELTSDEYVWDTIVANEWHLEETNAP